MEDGPVFFETEDSIDESVEAILGETWGPLSDRFRRLRKNMLVAALTYWIEQGYVVVPDDYLEGEDEDDPRD